MATALPCISVQKGKGGYSEFEACVMTTWRENILFGTDLQHLQCSIENHVRPLILCSRVVKEKKMGCSQQRWQHQSGFQCSPEMISSFAIISFMQKTEVATLETYRNWTQFDKIDAPGILRTSILMMLTRNIRFTCTQKESLLQLSSLWSPLVSWK